MLNALPRTRLVRSTIDLYPVHVPTLKLLMCFWRSKLIFLCSFIGMDKCMKMLCILMAWWYLCDGSGRNYYCWFILQFIYFSLVFPPTCRASEEAFLAESDGDSPGSEWERVARLCDFNPKTNKQAKDVSRMRSVLISLKQAPLVR